MVIRLGRVRKTKRVLDRELILGYGLKYAYKIYGVAMGSPLGPVLATSLCAILKRNGSLTTTLALQFWSIFVDTSVPIRPIALLWVSVERSFPFTEVEYR